MRLVWGNRRMAYFGNDAVNRINAHSAMQAVASSGAGVFFVVFLLRLGLSVPVALVTVAAIMALRFLLRPLVLPLAKRWGLKPLLIAGALTLAAQYPLLMCVTGVDATLVVLTLVAAIGDVLYWSSYNAYFAAVGDAEHRGKQLGVREALNSAAGVLAPLASASALLVMGPGPIFIVAGLIQASAILPLMGAPNVAIDTDAREDVRSHRIGAMLYAADGWFDACFVFVWQVALFVSLGSDLAAFGGAVAFAGLIGAVGSPFLGRFLDQGHARRAAPYAYGFAAIVVLLRAASIQSPWFALGANALGGLAMPLLLPVVGVATYNIAKAAACPLRFQIVAEGGWDVGCALACLASAALVALGMPLAVTLLFALPPLLLGARLLRRHFGARQLDDALA